MTNHSDFSRQGVVEPITIEADGSIKQAETTSCGLNGKPLRDSGIYPAYIACNLMSRKWFGKFRHPLKSPFIKRDGSDGDEIAESYISGMKNGYTAGFKFFDIAGGDYEITVTVRGSGGTLNLSTREDEKNTVGTVAFTQSESWKPHRFRCRIPPGKQALFFTYHGTNSMEMLNFTIKKEEE